MHAKFVKVFVKSREEIYPTCLERSGMVPKVFYPTYLEKGGMGKFSIPPTQVG
jgi:hypothetical protein